VESHGYSNPDERSTFQKSVYVKFFRQDHHTHSLPLVGCGGPRFVSCVCASPLRPSRSTTDNRRGIR
jgi:hypothetical protein